LVCILDLVKNLTKIVEQIPPGLYDLFRKHIFLSVHPEVREGFLGRVQDLCQIAELTFLVKDFVGVAEFLAILSVLTFGFDTLAEFFDMGEELFA
jgi:hypothetical protein